MIPASTLRRAYDQQAPDYDAVFTEQQAPKIQALAARMPASTWPAVDLGAGTGLVARLTGRRLIAVDLSAPMLGRSPKPGVQADLRRLPFPDAVFTQAWCVTALVDEGPVTPALAEIARVLVPGGTLALSILSRVPRSTVEASLTQTGFSILDTLDIPPDTGWICRKRSAG